MLHVVIIGNKKIKKLNIFLRKETKYLKYNDTYNPINFISNIDKYYEKNKSFFKTFDKYYL